MDDTKHGGWAKISGAATTDNSGHNLMGDASYLILDLGVRAMLWTRVMVTESTSSNAATESDLYIGLFKSDTDLTGGFTDGIYFRKDDGDTAVDCGVKGASVASENSNVKTLATSTAYDLIMDIKMDPVTAAKGTVDYYINGEYKGAVSSGSFPLNSVVLTLGAEFLSGDNTGTKIAWIDFFKLRCTR